jgi:hypothetical protein
MPWNLSWNIIANGHTPVLLMDRTIRTTLMMDRTILTIATHRLTVLESV